MTRRWAFATVGLAAGFSGIAVVATILTGGSLLAFEAALVLLPIGGSLIVLRKASPEVVKDVARVVIVGAVVGFVATLLYDVSRTVLSIFDPSPFNPFEAIRRFGVGIVPAGASTEVTMAAGFAIHFINGSSFGVIYAAFAGRRASTLRSAVLSGIAWGLTLELLQSIFYPGWLQITTVLAEFLVISGAGHLVYGASLGIGVRRLLANPPGPEVPR